MSDTDRKPTPVQRGESGEEVVVDILWCKHVKPCSLTDRTASVSVSLGAV